MAVYPHMPILHPHRCDILPDAGVARALADSSDNLILGIWGSKVHKNVRLPAQDADEPPRKI